ncbi:MAG: hypothetical protein HN712_03035, partial [Gemmatimonadetes bacterium]|nr:hypothetical protein [Gemmatimonadota bacterium]
RGRRVWKGKHDAKAAVYANRRRTHSARGQRLQKRRAEIVERSIVHMYDTGGMRRLHLRGRGNIFKRLLIHAGAFNLSLIMRQLLGAGTPRGFAALCRAFRSLLATFEAAIRRPHRHIHRPRTDVAVGGITKMHLHCAFVNHA